MQSNIDCIMDDLNDFPDSWVELYNAGDKPINLHDYKIGNNNDGTGMWLLPDSIVDQHSFVVVYCDKVGSEIHSSFRLESGKGCSVYLIKNDALVDSIVRLKKQPAPNISYGRLSEDSNDYGYQEYPTPGINNCGSLCNEILDAPIFSVPGRVVFDDDSFVLSLELPEGSPSGAAIYYTLDGSEPTKESVKYLQPIDISQTTIVRAKTFCDGYLSKRSITHSYIFPGRYISLPIISLVTNNDYLYDSNIGLYTEGSYQEGKPNYKFNWRRPINFEYFDKDFDNSCLNQLVEMRVLGGYSRNFGLKSLVLYANKRFGTKHFNYEFFPEDKPGIGEFKSIILRNAGNDYYGLYMRDAIIQRMMGKNVDLDWQAWQPAVIFINGNYKGILNIRERSDEDNIYSNYKKLDDIDLVETWFTLKEGSIDNYETFFKIYREGGHSLPEYEDYMDCNEFLNLMIMNLFFDNKDFPANNIVLWRPRTEDGKWRFIAKDCDFGLGLTNDATYNTIEWLYNPNYDKVYHGGNMQYGTMLFIDLMKDSIFRNQFIDRTTVYIGDFLNEVKGSAIFEPMYNAVNKEYPYHQALYDSIPIQSYEERFSLMKEWLIERPYYFSSFIKDKYNLGNVIPLTINQHGNIKVRASINDIATNNNSFEGFIYGGRTYHLNLNTDNMIQGWKIIITDSDDNKKDSCIYSQNVNIDFQTPECKSIDIEPIEEPTKIFDREWNHNIKILQSKDFLFVDNLPLNSNVSIYTSYGTLVYEKRQVNDGHIRISLNKNGVYILKINGRSFKWLQN